MLQHGEGGRRFQGADEAVIGERLLAQVCNLLGAQHETAGVGVVGDVKADFLTLRIEPSAHGIGLGGAETANEFRA